MARLSFADKLQPELRYALNARLRDCGYGSIDENVAWLAAKGQQTTRSSLHRHAQWLRQHDAHAQERGRVFGANREETLRLIAARQREAELLAEVGRLRSQEAILLQEYLVLHDGGPTLG